MKKLITTIFVLALLFQSNATHIAGAELSYRYIGDSTNISYHYLVTLRVIRGPSPVGLPSTFTVNISSSCFNNQTLTVIATGSGTTGVVTPSNTECFGPNSTVNTYPIVTYRAAIELSGVCADFRFYINPLCCRDQDDNLSNSLGILLNSEAWLNNTFFENRLVQFSNDAAVGLCPGWEVEWPISFVNPDSDSLFFSFAPIPTATYATGYTYQLPIMTLANSTFELNPRNAILKVTPSIAQIASVYIQVREFRHHAQTNQWVEVGRGYKDFKVIVAQSCNVSDIKVDLDLKTPVNCHDKVLEIDFSKNIRSNTIDPQGSDLVIYGPDNFLLAIDHIEKIHGLTQMRTEKIKVHLLDSVMLNGDYHVVTRIGNDLNTMISPCGYQLDSNDTIATFTIADASCGNISVDEIDLPQVKIYPNPVMDQLTVEPHNGRPYSVSVYDMQGRLLLQHDNLTDRQTFNTESLAPGVYIVKIYRGKSLLVTEKIKKVTQ